LKIVVTKSTAPHVLAGRIELRKENVLKHPAGQRLAAEVDRAAKRAGDYHVRRAIGCDVGRLLVVLIAEALAPNVTSWGCMYLGEEDKPEKGGRDSQVEE
jgi:hypothetical protein